MTFPYRSTATILLVAALAMLFWQQLHLERDSLVNTLWAFRLEPQRQASKAPALPVGRNYGKAWTPKLPAETADRVRGKNRAPGQLPGQLPGQIPGQMQALEDSSRNMDAFFRELAQLERGAASAPVRIAHYGDSPTTADLITADIRELLQAQYGDGGHGFYLVTKPWAWYGHRNLDSTSSGWEPEPATTAKRRDGLYGYGAVSFRGAAGAKATFRWKKHAHTRVSIAFAPHPKGGAMSVTACGQNLGEVDTASEDSAEKGSAGFAGFALNEQCRNLSLTVTRGEVRAFGIDLGTGTPGIVYDSLGINGAYISVLAKFLNEEHWSRQLQHYAPRLVIINYGTNESVFEAFVDKVFAKELRESIRRIRAALPEASILIMSPMDRGQRNSLGKIETVAAIEKLVQIERQVAHEEGVAFFDTFSAMGGNGTMREWYEGSPRLVGADFIHPMPAGAKKVGELLFRALQDGFNRYKNQRLESVIALREK